MLTEAHYKVAEKNGIPRLTAYRRVNEKFWDVERAITESVHTGQYPTGAWAKWREIAEMRGVTYQNFRTRLSRKWTEEEAAFTPSGARRGTRYEYTHMYAASEVNDYVTQ